MHWTQALTSERLVNIALLWFSFYWSRLRKIPLTRGLPAAVAIEPTTLCNLRCPQCPSGKRSFTRPTGNMDITFFKHLVDQVAPHAVYLTLYFQGEPFLHRHFCEMVQYATQRRLFTVTSTNGHFIDPYKAEQLILSGLGRLIFSVDGVTQESYQQYRVGGLLDRVLESIRNVVAAKRSLRKSHPQVVVQFLIGKHNEKELSGMRSMAKALKVDQAVFKTMQLYDEEGVKQFLPEDDRLARYIRNENGLMLKGRLRNSCWRMWYGCVVTWDGKVVPCCFDKDARYVMGDLNNNSLQEIWFGEPYRQFRHKILTGRSNIDICSNCSEGAKVWIRP
ncbi:MAG: SPASM domain-containing protein [Chitinophagales bacterium]|nr:SPASM domain-containing protein [Chitinophagales bacterium]MDW8428874.1 radical SAM/SPASM domain-containing protein [Chitinophagales bacterium]